MAQWLRACTAIAGDLNLVPSTHVLVIQFPMDVSSMGTDTLFWFFREHRSSEELERWLMVKS